jgi:hypothetical protein
MTDLSESLTSREYGVQPPTREQRLFSIGFLTAVIAAMACWLGAIGWVTFAATKWLLA